ncbi:MAG: hypothetical protein EOP88_23115 [Verrucomicrobiaceae bacterium]|nr:MAG: hypothetical protein EOP88_23115 [Verrucomicrobiaceae bacterium]
MRNLLTTLVIACGAIVPVATVQAAPASQLSEFAKKDFGGFKAGFKFTLKVKEITTIATSGKPPGSIPKFKKGEKIKFTIGQKGELIGPKKVKIKFQGTSANIVEYSSIGKDPLKLSSSGRIAKGTTGKPESGVITFNINVLKGFTPNSYQVSYTLEK